MIFRKKKMSSKPIFFNRPQQKVMFTAANTTVFVGGRRLGKSFGVVAPWMLRNLQTMPGSTGGIVGASFKQLLTRTLPGTLSALEHFGYKRGIHWEIGRKPPKSWGWGDPKIRPVDWTRVLSFYSGSIALLISQDREGSTNSATLDWVAVDEAKLANYTRLKEETFAANGGYRGHFGRNPWHHSLLIVSDMPTKKKGSWFLSYREKCNKDVIAAIQAAVVERFRLEQRLRDEKSVCKDYRYRIKQLSISLSRLRAIATYYEEFSSIQNIEVLGPQYISRMRRELPPLVFISSILCRRLTNVTDGFYSNMQDRHFYDATDYSHLDNLEYDFARIAQSACLADSDIDYSSPLLIALDYNANINWLVVGQRIGSRLNVLKSFFVKYDRKLPELCDDFCSYYSSFIDKRVYYYYDTTAVGSNYAVNSDSFASTVVRCLQAHGWVVEAINLGKPIDHSDKYRLINAGFAGHSDLVPFLNRENNEALILALEQAGCYNGVSGIHKDKRGEKLAESEEDKLEFRTDGTDAFDTLYIGALRRPPLIVHSGSLTSTFVHK